MASARFLEEALRTDVDETTVNAIVGSLETHLVTSTADSGQQQRHNPPPPSHPETSGSVAVVVPKSSISSAAAPSSLSFPSSSPSSSSSLLALNNISSSRSHSGSFAGSNIVVTNNSSTSNGPPIVVVDSSGAQQPPSHPTAALPTTSVYPSLGSKAHPQQQHHGVAPPEISSTQSVANSTTTTTTTNSVINRNESSKYNNNNHPGNLSLNAPIPTQVITNNNPAVLFPSTTTSSSFSSSSSSGHSILQSTGQPTASLIMSKNNNDSVKLVYPNQQQQQQSGANPGVVISQHQIQQQQPSLINMNNRVTFTSQTLPNGTINLNHQQHQQLLQQHQQQLQTSSAASMTVVGTGGGGGGGGGGAPIIKNSSNAGGQQPHLVIQKQGNQNVVQSSMMPGVQILNMRPGAQVNQQSQQQKTVAAVSPRVVTQMVGTRPTNASQQQQQITLSTLQTLQNSGQAGQAILLKTESGQFQLLRVGPSPVNPGGGQPNNMTSSSANQTIRLQTVPAQQTNASSSAPSIVVNSVSHSQPIQHIQQQQQSQQQQQQQQQMQQSQPQQTSQIIQSNVPAPPVASVAPVVVANNNFAPTSQQNTKEKCRKFLANLLDLSSREPRPVERNVRTLIQELIDAHVDPEVFCERLERLLNASPQPCLIGFLKKSLPLLRQSLVTKELVIEGIKPPAHNIAFAGTISANIPAQVRPVGQTIVTTGPRMVGQTQARPIGHTTITRHTAPVRIQAPNQQQQQHRMINATIRPGTTTTIVNNNNNHQMNPPALQPVSNSNMGGFTPGGAQIRPPRTPAGLQIRHIVQKQPTSQQQQHQQPQLQHFQSPAAANNNNNNTNNAGGKATVVSNMKVGSTQIKQITSATNGPSSATTHLPTVTSTSNQLNVATTSAASTAPSLITSTTSSVSSVTTPAIQSSSSSSSAPTTSTTAPTTPTTTSKAASSKSANASSASGSSASAAAKAAAAAKEKEKKSTNAAAAASAFYPQSTALSMASSMYGDDDINDVAAMGGVNLAEESQRILGSTELIGTQIRSCKDEVFLHMPALQARIRQAMAKHGLEEPSNDVAVLISHATQERLKNIVEKLAVIAEHRIDIIKVDPRYEVTKDVRGQIKFLEELDKAEQKRHEEQEREMLMRAAKSRSKTEDPEQAKLKAKAKEMQRAEMEELRQRDANLTALQAIGPRKKPKLEGDTTAASTSGGTGASTIGAAPAPLRPRIKRVNLKDMIFHLEQERETCRSSMLYKAYLK